MVYDRSITIDGIFGPRETMSALDAAAIKAKLARKCVEGYAWAEKYKLLKFYVGWRDQTKNRERDICREDLIINGKYSIVKGEVISCRWRLLKVMYKVKNGNFLYEIEDSIRSYIYNKKTGIKKGVPVYIVILGDDWGYEIVPENFPVYGFI